MTRGAVRMRNTSPRCAIDLPRLRCADTAYIALITLCAPDLVKSVALYRASVQIALYSPRDRLLKADTVPEMTIQECVGPVLIRIREWKEIDVQLDAFGTTEVEMLSLTFAYQRFYLGDFTPGASSKL